MQGNVRAGVTTLQDEYSEFINWLQSRTTHYENLIRTHSLPNNYQEYLSAKSEADTRFGLYNKLKNLVSTQHNIIGLTQSSWEEIDKLWNQHQYQLRFWLWMLDSNLPGDFAVVGKWLAEAEKLLYHDEIPAVLNEEAAGIISRKLEEHKQFFANYEKIKEIFYRTKQSQLADRAPIDQLRSMEQRINDVGPMAKQRRLNLKFLEHKCCIIAFMDLIENKLRTWTGKSGREDKAKLLLHQYNDFVHKYKVFQEFGKAFVDMQQVVEECKREGNLSRQDHYAMEKFVRDIEDRWKRVARDLKCCQNMLEESVANWHRWNAGADEFEGWLCRAEQKLRASEDERLEFFQDISTWKDKHQQLHDAATFLIATCEDKIANEIRDKFQQVTMRFDAVYANTKQYIHSSDILRNRHEYKQLSEKLSNWLRNADHLLTKQTQCTRDAIPIHGNDLQTLASEIDDIEEVFKQISKVIQSLVPDMTRHEVENMMSMLKQQKDALVRIRSQIPTKLHIFHQLCTQQESLEQGQKEMHHWLNDAEALLQSLSLTGNRDHLQEQLKKHRIFFTRTLYYKSMIESKNKVFQNSLKLASTDNTIDTSDIRQKMNQLNDRFNYVTQNAQKWEERLLDADNYWNAFRENERIVTEWIYKAEVFLTERHIESTNIIEERNTFFENVNNQWMNNLLTSGQDLLKTLPLEEQQKVVDNVEGLQKRWEDVLTRAPQHIIHLQFNSNESNFNHAIKDIEKEIQSEQQALNRNEDIQLISHRHQNYMANRPTIGQIEKSLENMKRLANSYAELNPSDKSLDNIVKQCEMKWANLSNNINQLEQTLHQIPVQWQTYHEKFQTMSDWMNTVDKTLKSIVQEVNSSEEFEKERLVFQVSFFFLIFCLIVRLKKTSLNEQKKKNMDYFMQLKELAVIKISL